MKAQRIRWGIAALVVLIFLNAACVHAHTYAVTDLGNLPNGADEIVPYAINDPGDIVGYTRMNTGLMRAFRWGRVNGMEDLGAFDKESYATDINDHGWIVGGSWDSTGHRYVAKWEPGQPIRKLLTFGTYSEARGINNSGQIAAIVGEGAYRVDADGTPVHLGALPGGNGKSFANAINASGMVVGNSLSKPVINPEERGTVWPPGGAATAVGFLPGATRSSVSGINDRGEIVGASGTAVKSRAFFRNADGEMTDLGDLPGGADRSYASQINASGTIVGRGTTAGGERAAAWFAGQILDLNTSLNASGSGWVLQGAMDVNKLGQIIGYGTRDGQPKGFLLTPLPTVEHVIRSPSASPPPPSGELLVFDRTTQAWSNTLSPDPGQDTIVLTPGWNVLGGSGPDDWPLVTAKEPELATSAANVVMWDWRENASRSFAGMLTQDEGRQLAASLQSALPDYAGQFHFIGHSLGSLVNRQAIDDLAAAGISGGQIVDTILDAPERIPSGPSLPPGLTSTNSNPIPAAGHYASVDNYITSFGALHPEARNVFLPHGLATGLAGGHSYAHEWYRLSIGSPGVSSAGFGTTPQSDTYHAQGLNLFSPLQVEPSSEVALSALLFARDFRGNAGKFSLLGVDGIREVVQVVGDVVVNFIVTQDGTLGDGSPMYVTAPQFVLGQAGSYSWTPLRIPAKARGLSFNALFQNVPAGNSLVVSIDDTILFILDGQYVEGVAPISSGLLDISQWQGQDKELFLGLIPTSMNGQFQAFNFASATAGSVTIDGIGFTFVSVPEPDGCALALLPFFPCIADGYAAAPVPAIDCHGERARATLSPCSRKIDAGFE